MLMESMKTDKTLIVVSIIGAAVLVGGYAVYHPSIQFDQTPRAELANAAGTITLLSPTNGTTVSSPVAIKAAYSGATASYMKVWVDGVADTDTLVTNSNTLNASIPMMNGTHRIVIEAGNAAGVVTKTAPISITVAAVNYTVLSELQAKTGWMTCGNCANTGATGVNATQIMKVVPSPSLSGSSAEFSISTGNNPWVDGYWWLVHRDVASTPQGPVKYIEYSFDLYIPSTEASKVHGIEFEVQQGLAPLGKVYNFAWGHYNNDDRWYTFDYVNRKWDLTNLPAMSFTSNVWHHIDAVFHVDPTTGMGIRDSLSVDGNVAHLNLAYPPKLSTVASTYLNNAFQLDTDKFGDAFHVFVDNMTVKFQP